MLSQTLTRQACLLSPRAAALRRHPRAASLSGSTGSHSPPPATSQKAALDRTTYVEELKKQWEIPETPREDVIRRRAELATMRPFWIGTTVYPALKLIFSH